MAEYLDVVDENGIPTGKTVAREAAHAQGIRHRTSHVWLLRRRDGNCSFFCKSEAMRKTHSRISGTFLLPATFPQAMTGKNQHSANYRKNWGSKFQKMNYWTQVFTAFPVTMFSTESLSTTGR